MWFQFKWWLWKKMFGHNSGFAPLHCDICGHTHNPGLHTELGVVGWSECYYYKLYVEQVALNTLCHRREVP